MNSKVFFHFLSGAGAAVVDVPIAAALGATTEVTVKVISSSEEEILPGEDEI